MSMSNKTKGNYFRDYAKCILSKVLNSKLEPEKKISIGNPMKDHAFDLVSKDKSIVIECKNYTWTKAGRTPSGKISTINEAVLYLSFLDTNVQKILCLMKSENPKSNETLAEYYVKTYGYLLRDIKVYEIEEDEIVKKLR